jgi:hypothetical protein
MTLTACGDIGPIDAGLNPIDAVVLPCGYTTDSIGTLIT